jgi:inner membrane protein
MASVGHMVVGFAAARASGPRTVARFAGYAALALLPDVDVIGFVLGVPYAAPWGHRGATHSLVFALGVAALLFAATRRWKLALVSLAVVASHGLLDTLTTGGLGAALLWPLSNARFFAPWRPIPVAPIGAGLLSARGLHVIAVELIEFVPLLAYALWPTGSGSGGRRGA